MKPQIKQNQTVGIVFCILMHPILLIGCMQPATHLSASTSIWRTIYAQEFNENNGSTTVALSSRYSHGPNDPAVLIDCEKIGLLTQLDYAIEFWWYPPQYFEEGVLIKDTHAKSKTGEKNWWISIGTVDRKKRRSDVYWTVQEPTILHQLNIHGRPHMGWFKKQWYHFRQEGSFKTGKHRLVINGNLIATADGIQNPKGWINESLSIMNTVGHIDDVRIQIKESANPIVSPIVNIPDQNLEAVIRETIGKPQGAITEADLLGITSLYGFKQDIQDLTGLEYCTNLTSLNLGDAQITDISPLVKLNHLQSLYLGGATQITDISPLSELIELTDLVLSHTQIDDISPLAKMRNLQWLDLYGTQVTDILLLAKFVDLQVLALGNTQITDISPLQGLTKLQRLGLASNPIGSDISLLSVFNDLQFLDLQNTNLTDVSPLAEISNLQTLWIGSNPITDISTLAKLVHLQDLSLREIHTGESHNLILDISPLAELGELQRLDLYNIQIADISPLARFGHLQRLELGSNQIKDLQPLVDNLGIDAGDIVDVTNNPLSDRSLNVHIRALINRGVEVKFSQETPTQIVTASPDDLLTTSDSQNTITESMLQVSKTRFKGQRWGLFIGIEDYQDSRITDLRYSIDDVQQITEILGDKNLGAFDHIRVMTNHSADPADQPTRVNILRALTRWLSQTETEDTILFFFSGHGATDSKNRNYLLPVDVQSDLLEDTAISIQRLNEMLNDHQRIPAQKVIVVLDSCRSGTQVGQKGFQIEGQILDPLFTNVQGRITFASCGRNESAYEDEELGHGVFSYFFTEGLKGQGDRDKDGYIIADELFTYVADNVRSWAQQHGHTQTPRKQSNVTGSILIGYHLKNLAHKQRESAQEAFNTYRQKLRSLLDLDVNELAQAEKLLERQMNQEMLTNVEQQWLALIRDLADEKVSVKVYLLAKQGLGIKPKSVKNIVSLTNAESNQLPQTLLIH